MRSPPGEGTDRGSRSRRSKMAGMSSSGEPGAPTAGSRRPVHRARPAGALQAAGAGGPRGHGDGVPRRARGLERPVAIKFLHAAIAPTAVLPPLRGRGARHEPAAAPPLRLGHRLRRRGRALPGDGLRHGRRCASHGRGPPRRRARDPDRAPDPLGRSAHAHAQGSSTATSSPRTSCSRPCRGSATSADPRTSAWPSCGQRARADRRPGRLARPNYMSPEQTREGTVDSRVDLYAAGVVLFEMLAGRSPSTPPRSGRSSCAR